MANSRERYARIAMDSKGKLRDAWNRFVKGWQDLEPYQNNITQADRLIQRGELKGLLNNNACEIVFVRRRPERNPVMPEIRRMLCSNSRNLFYSQNGMRSLNFHEPKTARRIDEVKHNIVVVWDIMMQDYRNVSMDTCYIRQIIPDDDTFWKYFNDKLFKMTAEQKINWMGSVSG